MNKFEKNIEKKERSKSMKNNIERKYKKITSKDLIYIGVFALLLIIAVAAAFGVTFTPIIQFSRMSISAFLCGPIYLLFVAKTQKPWAVLILGGLVSVIVGWIMFGNPLYALVAFSFFVVGEIILFIGKYKSLRMNMISYIPVGFWAFGPYGAWWYDGERMYQFTLTTTFTKEFTDSVYALMNTTSLIIVLASTLIAAVLSIFFTKALFKKHFAKAGLVK